ncbi:hypothetical protein DL98DRAFT_586028 [Cadophora sp. DSE1049]|nr:hypothetical protein DL98DRAFT_586028 [Cadophora sp. DSE1049]
MTKLLNLLQATLGRSIDFEETSTYNARSHPTDLEYSGAMSSTNMNSGVHQGSRSSTPCTPKAPQSEVSHPVALPYSNLMRPVYYEEVEQQYQGPTMRRKLVRHTPEPSEKYTKRRKLEVLDIAVKKMTKRQQRDAAAAARKEEKNRGEEQAYRNSLAVQRLTNPGGNMLYRLSNATKPPETAHPPHHRYPQKLSQADTLWDFEDDLDDLAQHNLVNQSGNRDYTHTREFGTPDGLKNPRINDFFSPDLLEPHAFLKKSTNLGLKLHVLIIPDTILSYLNKQAFRTISTLYRLFIP